MGIGSFFFGKSAPKVSDIERQTGYGGMWGLGNLAGAQNTGISNGVPTFDFSKSFQPVTPDQASAKYKGFGEMNKASSMYDKPGSFKQTYNPAQFNFASLPDQYFQSAYDQGAKNIRREGAGNLTQMQRALGPRNQGLLFKAAKDSGRQQNETLADLSGKLGLQRMEQGVQLGKEQQLAQAGEGYKGYQSRADLESKAAQDQLARAAGLQSVGQGKLAGSLDATNAEREYMMKLVAMLMDKHGQSEGSRRGVPNQPGFGKIMADAMPDSISI
jgi:hypothetical protein